MPPSVTSMHDILRERMRIRWSAVRVWVPVLAGLVSTAIACAPGGSDSPVATPTLSLSRLSVPLGSPIEMTYRFTVAPELPLIDGDYRVMVHFLDADEELMWTDDHEPPKPVSEWEPSERVEYTRTVFMPIYPYVGEATVAVGLYGVDDDERLPLAGEDLGQRTYAVATVELLPQSENVFVMYKDGWHPAEVLPENSAVEWQWTKKDATLAFTNPKADSTLYLHYDGRPDLFDPPQQVTISIGDQTIETFSIEARRDTLRRIPLTQSDLGSTDMVEVRIQLDKTFVPANRSDANSEDLRELGIRVFHAAVEPSSAM